ncbi:MAG: helix-turn-helix domain-containing protein [Candidatus Omnitrophica bacterium]|nr:helix-turn-helix domain-containing protein [Candidatus Omnitrophota bacterium]MBU1852312.1 helix-turn-helix domain-containing protein [Candidatus Omnitrophota bacterium]
MADRSECLSPKAVGRELQVSPQTIYNLIARGELAALKVGKQYRVTRIELDAYKERNRVGSDEASITDVSRA